MLFCYNLFAILLLVKKLGEGTVALARMAAPHVRAQGEKLLPKSLTSKSGDGHSKIDDVTEVAMGGLKSRWLMSYPSYILALTNCLAFTDFT